MTKLTTLITQSPLRLPALFIIIMCNTLFVAAQQLGINRSNAPADPSAIVDIADTTRGLLIPRMTTTQRNSISQPAFGLMIFNTSDTCLQIFTGFWENMWCSCNAPTITGQPTDTTVCSGDTISFIVQATGSGLTYQWQQQQGVIWNNLADNQQFFGTATNSLTVAVTGLLSDITKYRCLVSGSCLPEAVSATATLLVEQVSIPPQSIATSNDSMCGAATITLSVVGGSLAAGAQWVWYKDSCGGSAIATDSTITVLAANTATYYVRAEGVCGISLCTSKTITVNLPAYQIAIGGTADDIGRSIIATADGGYAIGGYTQSYGAGSNDVYLIKTNSQGQVQWTKTYGGSGSEYIWHLRQTADSGYILGAWTSTWGAGNLDMLLIKTDVSGNVQWARTYGGTNREFTLDVHQTADGGYIATGYTQSYGAGGFDMYVVKTDALGNLLWCKTIGSATGDYARAMQPMSDGGYLIVGYTDGYGAGLNDVFAVKLDAAGNYQWAKTYGGTNNDYGFTVVATADGGFAIAGYTTSYGTAGADSYLIRADSVGNLLWTATYGGSSSDYVYNLIQTADGGFALLGNTGSYGLGLSDVFLVKTTNTGVLDWARLYGGTNYDYAIGCLQASDGGLLLSGYARSFGAGNYDVYLIKTDAGGASGCNEMSLIPNVSQGGTAGSVTPQIGSGCVSGLVTLTVSSGGAVQQLCSGCQ